MQLIPPAMVALGHLCQMASLSLSNKNFTTNCYFMAATEPTTNHNETRAIFVNVLRDIEIFDEILVEDTALYCNIEIRRVFEVLSEQSSVNNIMG